MISRREKSHQSGIVVRFMANENECFGFRWKHSWCISCCPAMETGVNFVLISDVCIVSVLKRKWRCNINCLCLHEKSITTARLMSHQPNVCPHSQSVCLLVKLVLYAQSTTKVPSGRPRQTQVNKLIVFVPIHNHFLLVCLFVCFGGTDLTFVVDWALKNQLSLYLVCFVRSFLFCIYRSLACIRWWILNQYFHWFTHLISKSIILFSC